MLKWNKMEEIEPELEETPKLITVLTSSEVPEARKRAEEEYIRQLETRIEVTDESKFPRFVKRLRAEVDIVKNS